MGTVVMAEIDTKNLQADFDKGRRETDAARTKLRDAEQQLEAPNAKYADTAAQIARGAVKESEGAAVTAKMASLQILIGSRHACGGSARRPVPSPVRTSRSAKRWARSEFPASFRNSPT